MDEIARIFHTMSRSMETTSASKAYHHVMFREGSNKPWQHEISVDDKEDVPAEVESLKNSGIKAKHIKIIKSSRDARDHLKDLNSFKSESSIRYKYIKPDPIEKTDLDKAIKNEDKWTGRALALHSQIKSVGESHKLYPEYMETVRHSGEHEIALDKLEKRKKI